MKNKNSPQLSRRRFLSATGTLAAAIGTLGLTGFAAAAELTKAQSAKAASGKLPVEPFFGAHQSGILTAPQQTSSYFAAFDLDTTKRADVIELLKRWTDAANRMTRGETAVPLGNDPDVPPADSGDALGLAPARLTITFGFGPGLFMRDGVDRYGLASRRPEALVDLPKFNGDQLVPEKSGGDLSIQACADDPQVAFHAVRQLASLAAGIATIKWAQTGFASGAPGGGTPRNLMGFKDGTNNPPHTPDVMDKVVWVGDEGGWMKNGSYLVVRRIRISLEHWDKTDLDFQQQVVGRYKHNGAPLGKAHEFDPLDLAATDKDGNPVIPATAHSRVASAAHNDGAQILRRAYSYNDGANFYAERWPPWRQGVMYDAGLFFMAYQRDPRTGFIKINKTLATEDIMNQYTTHVGSAVFACPAGAREGSFIGAALFDGLG
ncbi:iron uptake transporter deferrochelatase/peroxidase subunit [Andreprevotia chitinilytica]|uniref:iron uptake transporter deferrochelatase/peroxidase subunit n=1 Tax=Andreprevotia chitinilytica TaxID=396808 RepID=UPI0005591F2C|nr:iron uptake transporter deferrochelatase/peroxidase subunit [Andreprevotia chitinilytica]